MRHGALALGLVIAACSGYSGQDDVVTPIPDRSDAGDDGGTDAAVSPSDAGPEASPDAGGPACDPLKPFGVPAPLDELNSASNDDLFGDLSADELTIYITTNRTSALNAFAATRTSRDKKFGPLSQVLAAPAGGFDVWNFAVSADGLTTVFSSTRSGSVAADIYLATRATPSGFFGTPTQVATLNSNADDEGPRFSADGKTLYFDTTKSGTRAIYKTSVSPGAFGAPVAITELNAAYAGVPVPTADELTMYFVSDRAPTTSGGIWVAKRATKTAAFGSPSPVAELNAGNGALDAPGWISPDGCRMYMTSTRSGGKFHLYVATRPL